MNKQNIFLNKNLQKNTNNPNFKNKALILDFDGTLRFSVGNENYPEKPSDVRILPNRTEVLNEYAQKGYLLLGASNQSCLSRGSDEKDIVDCFEKTLELLKVDIDYVYCPHNRNENCFCRKPKEEIGLFFINEYKLDPKLCIMVGDSLSDKLFAENCGFNFSTANDFFYSDYI